LQWWSIHISSEFVGGKTGVWPRSTQEGLLAQVEGQHSHSNSLLKESIRHQTVQRQKLFPRVACELGEGKEAL